MIQEIFQVFDTKSNKSNHSFITGGNLTKEGLERGLYGKNDHTEKVLAYRKSPTATEDDLTDVPLISYCTTVIGSPHILNIRCYHGRIAFQFDLYNNHHIATDENLEYMKDRLKEDKSILLAYKSIGEGLTVVIKVSHEIQYYPFAHRQAEDHLACQYGLTSMDEDAIATLFKKSFISLDRYPVYNPEAKALKVQISDDAFLQDQLKVQSFRISGSL